MARSPSSGGWGSQNFVTDVRDLWELVITYVKQETIDPVKGLGRYVGYGLAGSLAVGIASFLVLLGILRLLQDRTGDVFAGHLSFVPYLVAILGCALVAFLAIRAMNTDRREGA